MGLTEGLGVHVEHPGKGKGKTGRLVETDDDDELGGDECVLSR